MTCNQLMILLTYSRGSESRDLPHAPGSRDRDIEILTRLGLLRSVQDPDPVRDLGYCMEITPCGRDVVGHVLAAATKHPKGAPRGRR